MKKFNDVIKRTAISLLLLAFLSRMYFLFIENSNNSRLSAYAFVLASFFFYFVAWLQCHRAIQELVTVFIVVVLSLLMQEKIFIGVAVFLCFLGTIHLNASDQQ